LVDDKGVSQVLQELGLENSGISGLTTFFVDPNNQ